MSIHTKRSASRPAKRIEQIEVILPLKHTRIRDHFYRARSALAESKIPVAALADVTVTDRALLSAQAGDYYAETGDPALHGG